MPKLKAPGLFEPTKIGRMQLKNRLEYPSMVRNYATEDGFVTRKSIDHYERLARRGGGLIIVEATCVDAPRGKGFDFGLVLDDDRFVPGFAEMAEAVHRHGAKLTVQALPLSEHYFFGDKGSRSRHKQLAVISGRLALF